MNETDSKNTHSLLFFFFNEEVRARRLLYYKKPNHVYLWNQFKMKYDF